MVGWNAQAAPGAHASPTLYSPNVGTGRGEVPEAPRRNGDRRLELPFSFVIAACHGTEAGLYALEYESSG